MTQIYADGRRIWLAPLINRLKTHLEFFICVHLRHLRTKNGFAVFTRSRWTSVIFGMDQFGRRGNHATHGERSSHTQSD